MSLTLGSPRDTPLLLAFELKHAVTSGSDEWMYQLQDADESDPFKDYHEAMRNVLGRSPVTREIGLQQLKEYTQSHPSDHHAAEMLRLTRCGPTPPPWCHGWSPPAAPRALS
eukprot:RCo022117